jgi:hypothetical protein
MQLMMGVGGSSLFATNDFYRRFGLGDLEFNTPALSVGTATFAQAKTAINLAKDRGTTLIS